MRKELKRYSSVGNRNGILLFCSKIFTGEWENISSIKASCSFIIGVNLNFNCAEMLFEDIGLIEIKEGECRSKELIYHDSSDISFTTELCSFCFNYLLDNGLIDKDSIRFDEDNNCYYIPTSAFRLDSAILRNLLKELSALEHAGAKFFIAQQYEYIFLEIIRKKKTLTQIELLKKLEDEQKMGEDGELFVLNYEKKRLHLNGKHSECIKQISLIDVSAGYDIISYHDTSLKKHRYIEVKTYNGKEHFYWSSNEIKSAKLRGENYYLYLVDYAEIKNENYAPLMIANPFVELQKDDSWRALPNSFFVEKIIKQQAEDSSDNHLSFSLDNTNAELKEDTLLNDIDDLDVSKSNMISFHSVDYLEKSEQDEETSKVAETPKKTLS